MASLLHADSACAMLTCGTICLRTLCELFSESLNILNCPERALTRSFDWYRGPGGLPEPLARTFGLPALSRAWACGANVP